ncbi:MAG: type I DNA topoisomerase [Pseudomonadota bacterium]|nr:type I DNA topoisomerase [Pseudomonadota bacterium]
MGKSLVIVESPAKAKTINRYLGPDFVVKSSVGHIRDLPTGGSQKSVDPKERARLAAQTRKLSPEEKDRRRRERAHQQLIKRMGVDPEHDWQAHYEVLPGKEKVVDELRKAAAKADHIYLATDLDREGEAIAWHLMQAIGGDVDRYRRVVFNEITKRAITEAFQSPGELNLNRVNAQQARRFLDRVVGFMVSPLLWEKIARGLSAGRVQSVAVKLVVEREREIRAFVPEEYWELKAVAAAEGLEPVTFEVVREDGRKFRPTNQADTQAAIARLDSQPLVVDKRDDKPTQSRPGPPFITSTLQQSASTRLGFSVKKTMTMAQRLYEAGYITYMRTDSVNLSGDAVASCRGFISEEFGERYLPEQPNRYSSKSGAQEAHEAIRPSNVNCRPGQLDGQVERDAARLYELIWRQFVACQMKPAEFTSTTVEVKAGLFDLRARGRVLRFEGHLRVQPVAKVDDDAQLPDLQVGQRLDLVRLEPSQHFTKPPARFSEAALVKELEKRGIGRPSTYAAIISTIQDRGYVRLENRRFYAEKMGELVTDRLSESFRDLMDYGFTAELEALLDTVAEGGRDWKAVLNEFYADFHAKLSQAQDPENGMRGNRPVATELACPSCERPMQIRTSTTGVFLGCSGYALPPAERCKETINLVPGDEVVPVDADEEAESRLLRTKRRCALCGTAMESYLIDSGRKLHICGNSPDCPGHEVETGEFKLKGYDGPVIECDKCGHEMQLKTGRFGKYFGCTNPECKNTRKLLRNGQPAPPKMDPVPMPELRCAKVDDHYVLRDGASGLFLAASGFPKNRETRPPKVAELVPHRDEIDPKYHYLLEAPPADPEGNPSVIRFSRKNAEQYVMSEVDGKATGWRAHWVDGRWVTSAASKAKSSGGRKRASGG